MKNHLILPSALLVFSTALFSCSGKSTKESEETVSTAKTAEGEEHEEEHENPNTAMLTEAQVKSIGLELGVIEQKQITTTLKVNGTLKVPNQNKASVSSIYSGTIKSLSVQPGSHVSRGQAIATIANPDFIQAQSEYLNLVAKISLAELEVKRQRELNAGNAGALKNLQAAETELRTLRTASSTYAQQIRLMGINPASLRNGKLISVLTVRSPISGIISSVEAKIGSFIDVSTVIAEVVDNSQLHLDLFVYEKDIPKVKKDQAIHFTLTNNPGKEYDATIFSLGSSFEGESQAVAVHAKVVGDKSGLIDGMTVTALISQNKANTPAVPADAVVNIAGQDFIFMLTESHKEEVKKSAGKDSVPLGAEAVESDNGAASKHAEESGFTFEKIPVVKGTTEVGYTQITLLKDIPTDAKIVVKGAFFVLAKMTNSGEGEHGH